MSQVNIDIRVEHPQSKPLISKLKCEYSYFVLFAIANKTYPLSDRFTGCDFIAFHGDFKTNHINVYEYIEVPVEDTLGPRHFRRRAFREYARHLADDHIDKFNIDEMAHYIERYVERYIGSEVKRLMAQG